MILSFKILVPARFLYRKRLLLFWRNVVVFSVLLTLILSNVSKATTLTIGAGTDANAYFPVNSNSEYNYTQSTYLASEIVAAGAAPGTPGYINSISYYVSTYVYDFSSYCKDWEIYMGNTSLTTFGSTSDWIPVSSLTKVFGGTVSPSDTGWITITLATPFFWDGTSNLAVAIHENTPGYAYSSSSWTWRTTSRTGRRSIGFYRDATDVLPSAPPTIGFSPSEYNGTPNIQLDYEAALPCSGPIAGGNAVASATTVCAGTVVSINVTGATLGTGLTYEWESSSTGLAGSWTAISGATSATYSETPPAGTTTYYRRKITCTATGLSDYSTNVAVAALSPIYPPYTEDFESATVGVNIPCASYTSSWSMGYTWYIYDYLHCYAQNHTPGGSKYLLGGYGLEVATGNQEFWFTPALGLTAGTMYRFSYWYMNDGDSYYDPGTGAYIGNAQTRTAMTPIGPFINYANTTYKQYVTDFTVPSTGIYYAGIRVKSTYNCDFGIDDLNMIVLPECNTATSFGPGGKAAATPNIICSVPGTTTLSVSGTPAYTGLTFSWEMASGTPSSFSSAGITAASGSYSISANGIYYFRCKITCPATGLATYSDTVKVLTTPITPPYIEDFEQAPVPDNLPCASYSPSDSWGFSGYLWTTAITGSPGPSVENHTSGGSKLLLAGGELGIATGGNAYWYTPGLSLIAGKAYNISFWYKTASSESWGDGYNYQLGIAYGSSQTPSSMSSLDDTTLLHSDMKFWKQFKRGFVASTTGVRYIGILARSSDYTDYGVNIDDIGVEQLPPCSAKPAAGKAISEPSMLCSFGTSAFISLRGTSAASDFAFQWQESSTGSPGSWVNAMGGSGAHTPGYTTPPLSASIYYRCVVVCGLIAAPNADTSTPVRIQVGPITPPYIENFEATLPGNNVVCADFSAMDYWTSGAEPYYTTVRGSGHSGYVTIDNHTIGGKNFFWFGFGLADTYDNEYWWTPGINLEKDSSYQFSYWYNGSGFPYGGLGATLGMYYGTAQSKGSMIAIRPDVPNVNASSYKQMIGRFVSSGTGVYYFGVKVNMPSWMDPGIAVDDIGIDQLPLMISVLTSCRLVPVHLQWELFPLYRQCCAVLVVV